MSGAAAENARTLAALLGVTEDEATTLLDKRILVSADAGGRRLALQITRLLERTFTAVDSEPGAEDKYAAEVVIAAASRRAPDAVPVVFVGILPDEVVVDLVRVDGATEATCHELILFIGACYAAAATTKLALPLLPLRFTSMSVSAAALLGEDAPVLRQAIDLGSSHLAGAGAIGNAFVCALASLDVSGELTVCDPDVVSAGNLNRCLLFDDIHVGQKKAEVLCKVGQGLCARLDFTPFPSRLENFAKAPDGRTFGRLIVGVDSRRGRRGLQLEFPGEVYDASTTGIEEVVLHFNRLPFSTACMSCVYHHDESESSRERHIAEVLGVTVADVRENWVSASAAHRICARYPSLLPDRVEREAYDSLFKSLCGQGVLKTEGGRHVLAPFAFVSALAGALLAIELARRLWKRDATAPFNYWRLSPWGAPVARLRAMLPARIGCEACGNAVYREVAQQLWGKGDEVFAEHHDRRGPRPR